MKTRNNAYIPVLSLLCCLALPACQKLVDIPPPVNSLNSANVYSNDATAIAAVTGIYTAMSTADNGWNGVGSLYFYPALLADELTLFDFNNPSYRPFYTNTLLAVSPVGVNYWSNYYLMIYYANAALEGLNGSSTLTPAVKQQLLGEAYFIRAYCYFHLVNFYGDVPLALTSNYKVNGSLSRTPQAQVWNQIVSDLHIAQGLLSNGFLDGTLLRATPDRTRPTQWAATALLARSYLYTKNWAGADSAATVLIQNASLFGLGTLNGNTSTRAFAKNSSETIWAIQPVGTGIRTNTGEGLVFDLPAAGPNTSGTYPVYLSNAVLNAFEPGDLRMTNWVNSITAGVTTYYYPYKYQAGRLNTTLIEYSIQFRLAEQYLIRAEAEANETKAGAAVTDLNVIRTRAGLGGYVGATDPASFQTAILHERQVELFTEGAHRWFDLKRTGTIDAVMGAGGACAAKGGTWSTNWQWYPIPTTELTANLSLTQNSGY
ncbi:MAG: RagB/SusD family nutrient uptake outer membrane protein [Bacteroidota bacterium]|nr:RagB/SusD family nutrient uptake outer membrane protein [Bacteroidota bacterium]MDP4217635.1 RagB/SusD family nutrient uptake outer membrane protein [Bacteroidota bacterium]MDP4247438.1 RagB/SusD family nutrient uptake outer membrane protein [Bacteroidota bacterium]MDP4252690.1 RagB/SusD family nutrient uptake outer membrane protein [Bacteroidota bacterium]MDP4259302.1 RagB/SusD family nutrient uptake outer membrane protein [Bacteroidota bacterium]